MSAAVVSSGVRSVLDTPRGRRFSRPGGSVPLSREQRLIAQMPGNPRVAYRQFHGQLPAWMDVHAARVAERDVWVSEGPRKPAPSPGRSPVPVVPRPQPAPDDGPPPPSRPGGPPQPSPLPPRPRSHRKPRRPGRCVAWHLAGYTLAALAGALAHHLTSGLF